jgi:hypothetical protein
MRRVGDAANGPKAALCGWRGSHRPKLYELQGLISGRMRAARGWRQTLAAFVLLTSGFVSGVVVAENIDTQAKPTRRILILNEGSTWYPSVNIIDQGTPNCARPFTLPD